MSHITQAEYDAARQELRPILKRLNYVEETLSIREHLGLDYTAEIIEIRGLNAQHDRLVHTMTEFEITNLCPCNF